MPRCYPICLNIADALCVVVGGGAVAGRKAAGLLEAGARVRVVSPTLSAELQSLADSGKIEFIPAGYETAHLEGARLVFAATNNREVNAQIVKDAGSLHLTVNAADAPEDGDFIVPSVVRRGELCVSISTGGNNPLLAVRLQRELEARFGREYGEFVELLGQMRDTIKSRTDDTAKRHQALSCLLDSEKELRALIAGGRVDEAYSLAHSLIAPIAPPRSLE